MRINKLISMLIVMIFLCQSVGFCLPESNSTLRVPVNGTPRVKETIEREDKSIDIEWIEDVDVTLQESCK